MKHSRSNPLEPAFERAREALQASDADLVCSRCGARTSDKGFTVRYLGRNYAIGMPDVRFHPDGLSPVEQILVLHYLTSTGDIPARADFASYKDLPNGMFYYSAFRRNGPAAILGYYGASPERIVPAAEALDGRQSTYGDVSVELDILPRITMAIALFKGDDEFPPEVSLLFKSDIACYLPLEDISLLGGVVARKLIKITKSTAAGGND